jgi:hypothetical protein
VIGFDTGEATEVAEMAPSMFDHAANFRGRAHAHCVCNFDLE